MLTESLNSPLVFLSESISPFARDWRNQKCIKDWCRQYTLISLQDHEKWFERQATDPTVKMFGLETLADTDKLSRIPIGVCGFTSIDHRLQRAEFSLYIAPDFQRKGYATAGLIALFQHGFSDFNFNRIWGETFDRNPALEMFLKIGMVHEGTLRQTYFKHGKFIDSHVVSILRDEFFKRYPPV